MVTTTGIYKVINSDDEIAFSGSSEIKQWIVPMMIMINGDLTAAGVQQNQ